MKPRGDEIGERRRLADLLLDQQVNPRFPFLARAVAVFATCVHTEHEVGFDAATLSDHDLLGGVREAQRAVRLALRGRDRQRKLARPLRQIPDRLEAWLASGEFAINDPLPWLCIEQKKTAAEMRVTDQLVFCHICARVL